MANFLMVQSEFSKVENAYVLSGGAFDRGALAAALFFENRVNEIWCTGENLSPDMTALGIDTLESEITRWRILSQGVPDSVVSLLPQGTSTQEEALVILEHCKANNIEEIVVISSKFHTKRISKVFSSMFKNQGISVYIKGAPSSQYKEEQWWESEQGLIALNNEYIKLLYYSWKY